jgi:hypothetical protein
MKLCMIITRCKENKFDQTSIIIFKIPEWVQRLHFSNFSNLFQKKERQIAPSSSKFNPKRCHKDIDFRWLFLVFLGFRKSFRCLFRVFWIEFWRWGGYFTSFLIHQLHGSKHYLVSSFKIHRMNWIGSSQSSHILASSAKFFKCQLSFFIQLFSWITMAHVTHLYLEFEFKIQMGPEIYI